MNKQIEFEFERATKNTYRFQENTYRFQENTSTDPVIGTLYVQKAQFGSQTPKGLRVTVERE